MVRFLLYPASFIYGLIVSARNWLFDFKILTSTDFDVPVISIGNITVGGTGKTPHTEYLIRLLRPQFRVATLSRGYKRKSKGFRLVQTTSDVLETGDEPLQMKKKFPNVTVAVCEDRVKGVTRLMSETVIPDVVLLDDAFQHRWINPGINILLIDYNKPLKEDQLLPAGRLRESYKEIRRANIIIITKCPAEITPITRRIIEKDVRLFPYQDLFFTTMVYGRLTPVYPEGQMLDLFSDTGKTGIILVTGIASPEYVIRHISNLSEEVEPVVFGDHHFYSDSDIHTIVQKYHRLKSQKKMIVTTEKDLVRLTKLDALSAEIRSSVYYLPIQVKFLDREGKLFDKKITDYVGENKSNRELHLRKNRNKG